eukprot:TRINITY_DN35589_c0_g1_i1.p1 TRINITY_DN35589_c0_g1~~TRINITY_DN35589_c0_g1_i1.p1  ORF type:complete len:443 (-),score=90.85 TRINITY_DN35589_c0_g1_i1:322-1650(-)
MSNIDIRFNGTWELIADEDTRTWELIADGDVRTWERIGDEDALEIVQACPRRRPARKGDTVILRWRAFAGQTVRGENGQHQHCIMQKDGETYIIGSGKPLADGSLSGDPLPSSLSSALIAMREGEVALIHLPGPVPFRGSRFETLTLEVELSQICTSAGLGLRHCQQQDDCTSLREVILQRVRELNKNGITVLRGFREGALSLKEVQLLRDASMRFFTKALTRVGEEMEKNPNLVIRYLDCVARKAHRMHVKPPEMWDTQQFDFLHRGGTLHEVLHQAFGTKNFRLTHCGALMAKPAVNPLPNNVNQAWHRDAPEEKELSQRWDPYAVVVYIPLIDMTARSGVTEFLVGSHRQASLACESLEATPPSSDQVVSTAGLAAGDVVIFDLRICHRGMLHTDPESGLGELGLRPVVALNFGVDEWRDKEDAANWGETYLVSGTHGK